jgi:hypothetical protein
VPKKKTPAGMDAARTLPAPFAFHRAENLAKAREGRTHVYGKRVICDTESRGHATPGNRSPLEIVLDASDGFIPLWDRGVTLRWRFQERAMAAFQDPAAAKNAIKTVLSEALLMWGDAAPIKFAESEDAWDFEIAPRRSDSCSPEGCVLASAFFPDAGRHQLLIYPMMFTQGHKEQVDTLVHEIGHVFGLRHFFAQISETGSPSVIFGAHKPFSIMNYGNKSQLTKDDTSDLKRLYAAVWSGELKSINGTPIQLVRPFSALGSVSSAVVSRTFAAAPNVLGPATSAGGTSTDTSSTISR